MLSVFIFVLIIILLDFIYRRTSYYREHCGNRINMFRKLPDHGIDGIIVGSAQAYYGIDFEREGFSIINCAGAPQSMMMSIAIANENMYRVKKNGMLVVIPPPCAFFFSDYNDGYQNEVYYSLLKDKTVINGYNFGKMVLYTIIPSFAAYYRILKHFYVKIKKTISKQGNVINKKEIKLRNRIQLRIEDWDRVANINVSNPIINAYNKEMMKNNYHYIKELLLSAKSATIKTVIIIPPMISEFFDSISHVFWQDCYINIIESLCKETDSLLLDYSQQKEIVEHEDYFQNIDFLNDVGKITFTHLIIKNLEGEHYL